MCTGGESRRHKGFISISNKNCVRNVCWRRKDAFCTHLAHWYDVPAQSYLFQRIQVSQEIQRNSRKFKRNSMVWYVIVTRAEEIQTFRMQTIEFALNFFEFLLSLEKGSFAQSHRTRRRQRGFTSISKKN